MYRDQNFKLYVGLAFVLLFNGGITAINVKPNSKSSFIKNVVKKRKVINLENALTMSIKTHPSVLGAFYDMKSTIAELNSVKGSFMPSFNFGTDYKFNKKPGSFFESSEDGNITSDSGVRVYASVNYNVFSSFKDVWSLEKASSISKSAVVDYHSVKMNIAREAGDNYIEVRKLSRLVKLYEKNVSVHKEFLDKVKKRVAAGQLAKDAIDATKSKLEEANQALISAQSQFLEKSINLETTVGVDAINVVNAKINDDFIPKSLDDASYVLQQNNAEMLKARHGYKVASLAYKETVSSRGPTVDVSADISNINGGYNPDFNGISKNDSTDFSVSVKGNWSIRGGTLDIIKSVAAKKKRAYYNMLAQTIRSKAGLKIAWNNRISASKKSTSLLSSVKAKKDLMEGQIKKFDLNKANLISVLARIQEYNQDKTKLISAHAELDKIELEILTLHLSTANTVFKL